MIGFGAFSKVIEKWQREGIHLLPPLAEAQVTDVLDSIDRAISKDVRQIYTAVGGMAEGEMDGLMFSLWSLERVVSENEKYNTSYLLFADFLIDSHLYCLRYKNDDESSVHIDYFDGSEPRCVAQSVSEFFELYLSNPDEIYLM